MRMELGDADSNAGSAAELFERVSENIKVKRYSEALDDLNSAIEADPKLSEAYWHRASVLRQLCRFIFILVLIIGSLIFCIFQMQQRSYYFHKKSDYSDLCQDLIILEKLIMC